jgi:hypothetical protein
VDHLGREGAEESASVEVGAADGRGRCIGRGRADGWDGIGRGRSVGLGHVGIAVLSIDQYRITLVTG